MNDLPKLNHYNYTSAILLFNFRNFNILIIYMSYEKNLFTP
jgi:hypothetical protein